MRIQHNIAAMNSYRNYNLNASSLNKNLEKLSSGYKINRAGDDAAGLAISEKMRAQITGLETATKNVKDGISLVKTAEGALQEVHDMLNRMKELATQSANGTYDNDVDRANLQKEVEELKSEINRIADSSNFNGIKLLDGSLAGKSEVSNVTMDLSKGVKGEFSTGSIAKTEVLLKASNAAGKCLGKADIGKSMEFTYTWKDANGNSKSTTVSLTFQGDGKGQVVFDGSKVKANTNYFVDNTGAKYYVSASGTLSANDIKSAIETSLKADKDFSNAFEIANASSGNGFKFTAKLEGASGAVMTGGSFSTNFKGMDTNAVIKASKVTFEDITVDTAGLDSMQKFAAGKLKTANKTMTADVIQEQIFEIAGKKFLISVGGSNALTNDQLKALGPDVNVISLASSAFKASVDTATIATEISKATGLETAYLASAASGSAALIAAMGDAGLVAGDIWFTEDKLSTDGSSNVLTLQIGDTADKFNQMDVKIGDMHADALGIGDLSVAKREDASEAIDRIMDAINTVSSTRGTLGATQNRLEHTQNNLTVMTENIQDAESTIRDTDVAAEMMIYTKNNILLQSAQAMLAQANQQPQGVLQLLG